jgi:hypothetical protein
MVHPAPAYAWWHKLQLQVSVSRLPASPGATAIPLPCRFLDFMMKKKSRHRDNEVFGYGPATVLNTNERII